MNNTISLLVHIKVTKNLMELRLSLFENISLVLSNHAHHDTSYPAYLFIIKFFSKNFILT